VEISRNKWKKHIHTHTYIHQDLAALRSSVDASSRTASSAHTRPSAFQETSQSLLADSTAQKSRSYAGSGIASLSGSVHVKSLQSSLVIKRDSPGGDDNLNGMNKGGDQADKIDGHSADKLGASSNNNTSSSSSSDRKPRQGASDYDRTGATVNSQADKRNSSATSASVGFVEGAGDASTAGNHNGFGEGHGGAENGTALASRMAAANEKRSTTATPSSSVGDTGRASPARGVRFKSSFARALGSGRPGKKVRLQASFARSFFFRGSLCLYP
jgi:hypothetical protein